MPQRHPDVKVTTILPTRIDTPISAHARSTLEYLPKPPPLCARGGCADDGARAQHPQRELPVGGSAAQFVLGHRFAANFMDLSGRGR